MCLSSQQKADHSCCKILSTPRPLLSPFLPLQYRWEEQSDACMVPVLVMCLGSRITPGVAECLGKACL